MPYSDFWTRAAQRHMFGIAAYVAPAQLYVGLSTQNPTRNGSGMAEPAGGGYARVAGAPNVVWVWNETDWRIQNAQAVTFPNPTAPWGLVTHAALFDAAAPGGNFCQYGQLNTAKNVVIGDPPHFDAGSMIFRLE
jgi:hypothetical protein